MEQAKPKKTTRKKTNDNDLGLKLYYQPIVQPAFSKIIGYEALIRLIDKELHFISPGVFIPIAEKSGLNIQLGNWVIEETCGAIQKMQKKEIPFEYISLNVSTKHFQRKVFVTELLKIVEEHDVLPEKLCFEVDESSLTSRTAVTINKMKELQDLGFKIALDNYSGDYINIAELASIPANILKIDKRIISRIVIDPKSKSACEDIIENALDLKLDIVANAVEDSVQQKLLMQMGCQKMQGFLFDEPLKERDILYPKKKKEDAGSENI